MQYSIGKYIHIRYYIKFVGWKFVEKPIIKRIVPMFVLINWKESKIS